MVSFHDIVLSPDEQALYLLGRVTGSVDLDKDDQPDVRGERTWFLARLSLMGRTLPVELSSLQALADADAVTLAWTTLSEANNAGFEVQHFPPGHDQPAALAFLEGHGTSAAAHDYRHRVTGLAPGRHRFRLKQVDYDGTAVLSPTVEATVTLPEHYRLTAPYPNPFNPETVFTLTVGRGQEVRVVVVDALGREVALLHAGALEGDRTYRFRWSGSGLPSGVYVIQAVGAHFSATRTALLVK
jgi:hypothetical protein